MKITMTGGAGYVGSVLVPLLLKEGYEVTVLDNFQYKENSLALCCRHPNFSVHRVDIRDTASLKPFLKEADVVIPLAALVGAPICDRKPHEAYHINLLAQLSILEAVGHDQRVIMPTTESVYGSNAEICTEETACAPLSTYGKHKLEVEEDLLRHTNSVSLRLATVFGMSPRMRLDLLINDFTWRSLHDRAIVVFEGHYRRTSVHVQDVAAAFLHMLKYDRLKGIFNVGNVHCTKVELCEAIQRQVSHFSWSETTNVPKDEMGKDPDQRNYIVSDEKIRKEGFHYGWDLESGIKELLKGYVMLDNNRYGNVP